MAKQIKEVVPDHTEAINRTEVVKFDRQRFQLSTNDKAVIGKLKELNIDTYGYAIRPQKSQYNTRVTILNKFDNFLIYLINEETLTLLKNKFNGSITIEGEKKRNGRQKKSK